MKISSGVIMVLLVAALASFVYAEEIKRTVNIAAIEGDASVRIAGGAWAPAAVGMALNERDSIRTKTGSTVSLNVDGEGETATVDLSPNSELMMAELFEDPQSGAQRTLLDLAIGKVLIKAKKIHSEEERFEVKTPTTIVGVRGTTFEVNVEAVE